MLFLEKFIQHINSIIVVVVSLFLKLNKEKLLLICSVYILFQTSKTVYSQSENFLQEKKVFYYASGEKSSEGQIVNGKATGIWNNYYENGNLKSKGLLVNDKTDSLWKFYTEQGILKAEIEFSKGIKNGIEKTYDNDGLLLEEKKYINGSINGYAYSYANGKMISKEKYIENKRQGYGYQFKEERIISILNYVDDYVRTRDAINRFNTADKKTGKWVLFYPCSLPCNEPYNIQFEERYSNGIKNGIFREYSEEGALINQVRYLNGEIVNDSTLMAQKVETSVTYFSNGNIKEEGTVLNAKKHGFFNEYDSLGNRIKSIDYRDGKLIAQGGIISQKGLKSGFWKYYYSTGELKSEGNYKDGHKIGKWKWYFKTGKIQQIGKYKGKQKAIGNWIWYYESGEIKRTEDFINGKEDGYLIEYTDSGSIITKGEFIEGLKEGFWFYQVGDYREEGKYASGEKTGEWKEFYTKNDTTLIFKGSFIDGIPIEKHTYFDPIDGKKMLEGKYVSGMREGRWYRYNKMGEKVLEIEYRAGKEYRIDGKKMKPFEDVDEPSIDYLLKK